ncbi:hypothetical protein L9F63_008195 [Diploptera punctata]|uniref:Uncharacterized protein n=1 Tax=Diploptera punctata TaxID=6984 RepID=A0AAD8E2B3_DIPPU|nr:hypothetical protein L9F63_008195 [Diploptera punctata]
MARMLQSSTCEEQRSVVRFLWAKGHKPSEIHRDMRGIARWVPKNLTDDHKGQRMMASLDHLTRYTAQGHDFLEGIVTGDESWAYHYTPETKQASAVRRWLHSNQTDFYEQGILKLVTRWEKCVEKVGDYVEK